jgi:hypothetical protein
LNFKGIPTDTEKWKEKYTGYKNKEVILYAVSFVTMRVTDHCT